VEPIGGLGPIEGGKEESALDELLLAQLATEAHGLPNGWVRETDRGGAEALSLKNEYFSPCKSAQRLLSTPAIMGM
jgi:hypothetical protein